jgi:hypothetical protein
MPTLMSSIVMMAIAVKMRHIVTASSLMLTANQVWHG